MDQKLFKDSKAEFAVEVSNLGSTASEVWPKSREVSIAYRGVVVPVVVSSHNEHFAMQFMAYVKGVAVLNGQSSPMFSENKLVPQTPKNEVKVDDAFLEEAIIARSSVTDLAIELEQATGDDIVKLLRTHYAVLVAMDGRFAIEIGFFTSMAGEAGQKRYHEKIL